MSLKNTIQFIEGNKQSFLLRKKEEERQIQHKKIQPQTEQQQTVILAAKLK